MLDFTRFEGIYFYGGVVDFRRGVDGLSLHVQEAMGKGPELLRGVSLFLFVSRDKRKVKILYWNRTGFALWYFRLERERFAVERGREPKTVCLDRAQLEWLLSGVDWWRIKRHEAVNFEKVG